MAASVQAMYSFSGSNANIAYRGSSIFGRKGLTQRCGLSVSRASYMVQTRRSAAQRASASNTQKRVTSSPPVTSGARTKRVRTQQLQDGCTVSEAILVAEKKMSDDLGKLKFGAPVTHVYNPLEYAWDAHEW